MTRGLRWHGPSRGHASRGPLDQELEPTYVGRALPFAIARVGVGYPDPPSSNTFCRELAVAGAGEARAALASSPGEPAFARFTAEEPAFTGSLGFKGRFLRSSAKKSTIGCTQGVFHRGSLTGAMGPRLGKPSQASSSPGR